ncbi:MAG: thioredoxin domain-containing protein [Balneolaceae bacterium]
MPNRLADEKSPYLLQHAGNPVNWFPWSSEAFDKARKEDKPVFLSVGYATCHWCHVMAHESFEDSEVAGLLNESFVNIKVDREERPDIDNTYMTVCQMLTGQGGWPLTVILTPDKRPFFAATYIPKETRFNRPGMKELIPRIHTAWTDERQKVLESAEKISQGFSRTLEMEPGDHPRPDLVRKTRYALDKRFDPENGGFGTHPKFPSPQNLLFLMQYSLSFDDSAALRMADLTLEKMRFGGIYDHIGYGFHRYSTDQLWLLPHFEKMLYDQALLMLAFTEGWKHTGNRLYRQTVYEMADFVQEQLTSDEGGFFSAEDADSEGEEGKFYIWDLDQVRSLLGLKEAALFTDVYNIEPDGNFKDESTGRKTGKNIPYLKKSPRELAEDRNMDEPSLLAKLDAVRKKLKKDREKRPRPLRDDKILTDWNGLMIAAFARAGAVFEDRQFTGAAERAWQFVSGNLVGHNGRLLHRYRRGESAIPAMADDYAFLIWGLIELTQATCDVGYLEHALDLNEQFMNLCWDENDGGVFFTGKEGEELLGRQKEIYDGAIPSSNSVTAMNLLRLGRLTGRSDMEKRAEKLFRAFISFLEETPGGSPHIMQALMFATKPSAEIVISGQAEDPVVQEMIRTLRHNMKMPFVLLLKNKENSLKLSELAPFTRDFPVETAPSVYVCHQFKCEAPVQSVSALKEMLG